MKITESRSTRGIVLFVAGVINDSTSPLLQNELFRVSKMNNSITLDFVDVLSIDTSGLRALHSGVRAVASRRGRLSILNANAAVKNALQTDGLGRLLTAT